MTRRTVRIEDESTRVVPGQGGALVFWILIAMGVAVLTPTVLLPEWNRFEKLDIEAQRQAHEVALLEKELEQQQRLLRAINSDPAVINRLARRELNYRNPEEVSVPVEAPIIARVEPKAFEPTPPAPPGWVSAFTSRLPHLPYNRIFGDEKLQPILTVLSVGVIVVAFLLFGTHRRPATDVDD